MNPLPLKWRLSFVIAAALAAVIATICIVTYVETRELWLGQVDRVLDAMSATAVAIINETVDDDETTAQLKSAVNTGRRQASFFRIWAPQGQERYASGKEPKDLPSALAALSPPETDQRRRAKVGAGESSFRVLWTLAQTRQGPLNILVGQSLRGVNSELDEMLQTLTIIGAAAVALSLTIVTLVVAWSLRPIGATAKRLVEVTARNVGHVHLATASVHAELRPFVQSVNDMLDRLDKAMERQKHFVADASHELRTPMTLAKSTVQLALSRDRSAADYKDALTETLEDLRRMERLIGELMSLARLDESATVPDAAEVDLAALLQELAETFSPLAARDGGRIVCSLAPAKVTGNAGELGRLFGNLIDNAIHHGPRGGQVDVALQSGPGRQVTVTVKDQGGGIDPALLPRLFDRFFRADPSRSHATGGTGLGLAIAQEIAVRHGGRIAIASSPVDGTVATVELPIAD